MQNANYVNYFDLPAACRIGCLSMAGIRLTLKLTPHGRLTLDESGDSVELAPE